MDKAALRGFYPSMSISLTNLSTDCFTHIIIHHPGLVQ
jgi:hypothetical protein